MNEESADNPRYQPPSSALVGLIVGPWGMDGEVRVQVQTDNPERFSPGSRLTAQDRVLQVEACRWHKGFALVRFQGIDTPEEVVALRGVPLEVSLENVPPLSQGTYYYFQVLDMEVYTVQGELLGTVQEILNTGSNDVYVVRLEKQEVLVPALDDVVVEVDTERGRMTVDLPDGLR